MSRGGETVLVSMANVPFWDSFVLGRWKAPQRTGGAGGLLCPLLGAAVHCSQVGVLGSRGLPPRPLLWSRCLMGTKRAVSVLREEQELQ